MADPIAPQRRPCPHCGEDIAIAADICPHCREEVVVIWRDGDHLKMKIHSVLPNRCVKCNRPAQTREHVVLFWHPSWLYLLVLPCFLIYFLVALPVRKTAEIDIGLTSAWARKRRLAFLLASIICLAGMGVLIAGIVRNKGETEPITIVTGIGLIAGGLSYGRRKASLVTAWRITNEFVWLEGVCRDYLNELPDWAEWNAQREVE